MGFHTGAIQLLTVLSYLLVGQMRVYLLLSYEVNDDKYMVLSRGRSPANLDRVVPRRFVNPNPERKRKLIPFLRPKAGK